MSDAPRWDLSSVYPSLDAPELTAALAGLEREVGALERSFDRWGIGSAGSDAGGLDRSVESVTDSESRWQVETFEVVLDAYNAVVPRLWLLETYVAAFVDTDAADSVARARASELRPLAARLSTIRARLDGWLGGLDPDPLIAGSATAQRHALTLRRARVRGTHLMSPEEERLAADLHVTGGAAWGALHGDLTARMTAAMGASDGSPPEVLPLGSVRALASHPDRGTRRRADEAEASAWAGSAVPLVAALNGVKGEALALSGRRGWATPLDAALFDFALDRATLEALLGAVEGALPDVRRYLRAKARALGVPVLAWYDRAAPLVPDGGRRWSFADAASVILGAFARFSPAMGALAERAVRERWIDAEPRAGKRGGGLCMVLRGEESRIRVDFRGTDDGVRMLAHELGHAYHGAVEARAGRTALQMLATPPTLAEVASTFAQTLVQRAARHRATPADELAILDATLQSSCRSVADVLAAFRFEERFFARRQRRELGADEANALMVEAQGEVFGDALDPDTPFPWVWAAQPHFYLDGISFYNLPYCFGLLFALGLATRAEDDPVGFPAAFDRFLAGTGTEEPAALAAGFGLDLRNTRFWDGALGAIRAEIDRFEALVDGRATG